MHMTSMKIVAALGALLAAPLLAMDQKGYLSNCRCTRQCPASQRQEAARIVGGEETGVNEFPMMAGLVDIPDKILYCGATIISKRYVLTAARCVQNRDLNLIFVVVGEHDVTTGKETNATRVVRIASAYHYPIETADIAVVKLAEKVNAVCLPFSPFQSFINETVTALGWGLLEFHGRKSDTLQKVDLRVVPCDEWHPGAHNLCTYTPGKDTCQMDSGGPLLWRDPESQCLVLAGISSGTACASDVPSYAIRAGDFVTWIEMVTRETHCYV